MYYSTRAIYKESQNYAIFSSFRNKYDPDELSLMITRQAPSNPIVQYFFKAELGHEVKERLDVSAEQAKLLLDIFSSEWRLFYWLGLFSLLDDKANLNNSSVLSGKLQTMDGFMQHVGRFLMKNCYERHAQVVVRDSDSVPLANVMDHPSKNFKVVGVDSPTFKGLRQSVEVQHQMLSLCVPEYLHAFLRGRSAHLVFLWLRRLAGNPVDNLSVLQKSLHSPTDPGAFSTRRPLDKNDLKIQDLQSKIIANRNSKVYPLSVPEFLYSPTYTKKTHAKFKPIIFYNLTTQLNYQFRTESFLSGDEWKALNQELRGASLKLSKWFAKLPRRSSIAFFSKDKELIDQFSSMRVTPANLRSLYSKSIRGLKETVCSIISGQNKCFFEPNVLVILVYMLSFRAKQQFVRTERQFSESKKLAMADLEKRPRNFVKSLRGHPPPVEENRGIYTSKLHEMSRRNEELNRELGELADPSSASQKQFHHFPQSQASLFPLRKEYQPDHSSKPGASKFRRSSISNPMKSLVPPQFYGKSPSPGYSSKFKKEHSNFLNLLLGELGKKGRRVVLSEEVSRILESISVGYQIKNLFRNNPIYNFKALSKMLRNLNPDDHNLFQFEQGNLLLARSTEVFSEITKYNNQLCAELQAKLESSEFGLGKWELAVRDLTSPEKLRLYLQLMQDSIKVKFIGESRSSLLTKRQELRGLSVELELPEGNLRHPPKLQKKSRGKGPPSKNLHPHLERPPVR